MHLFMATVSTEAKTQNQSRCSLIDEEKEEVTKKNKTFICSKLQRNGGHNVTWNKPGTKNWFNTFLLIYGSLKYIKCIYKCN